MRSCRNCGNGMEVSSNCHVCKKPIEFICNKCNRNTDKEIHLDCIYEKIQVLV
jgi:predicted amidophosphoribosyltransferase